MSKKYSVDLGINTNNFSKDSSKVKTEINSLIRSAEQANREFKTIGSMTAGTKAITDIKTAIQLAEDNVKRLREQLQNAQLNKAAAGDIAKLSTELRNAETQASRARTVLGTIDPPKPSIWSNFWSGLTSGFTSSNAQFNKLSASISGLISPITNASGVSGKLGAALGVAGGIALDFGAKLAKSAIAKLQELAKWGLQAAADIVKGFGNMVKAAAGFVIEKVVSGVKALAGQAVELGKSFIKVDQDVRQLDKQLKGTLSDGETGAKTVRDALNNMPVHQMTKVSDSIQLVSQYMQVTGKEALGLGTNIADISSKMGLSAEQTKSFALAFSQSQAVGKLLTQDFRQMGAASGVVRDEIIRIAGTDLGINASNFNAKLSEGKISADLVRTAVENVGASAKGASAQVTSIGEGLSLAKQSMDVALFTSLSKAIGFTGDKSSELGTKIVELAGWFGKTLGTAIGTVVNWFIELDKKYKIVDTIKSLWDKLVTSVKALVTPLQGVVKNMTSDMGGAQGILSGVGGIFKTMSGVVANLVPVVARIIEHLKELAKQIVDAVGSNKQALFSSITSLAKSLGDRINEVIGIAKSLVSTITGLGKLGVFELLITVVKQVSSVVTALAKGIVDLANDIIQRLGQAGGGKVMKELGELVKSIGTVLKTVIDVVVNLGKKLLEVFQPMINVILPQVANGFKLIKTVIDVIPPLVKLIGNAITVVFELIKPVEKILSVILDVALKSIWKFIDVVIIGAVKGLGSWWQWLSDVVKTVAQTIQNWFSPVLTLIDKVSKAISSVTGAVKKVLGLNMQIDWEEPPALNPTIAGYAGNMLQGRSIDNDIAKMVNSVPAASVSQPAQITNITVNLTENNDGINKLIQILRRNGVKVV